MFVKWLQFWCIICNHITIFKCVYLKVYLYLSISRNIYFRAEKIDDFKVSFYFEFTT